MGKSSSRRYARKIRSKISCRIGSGTSGRISQSSITSICSSSIIFGKGWSHGTHAAIQTKIF